MNPGSSDSKNILRINQEVRRIYHHLCRHGGEEGSEKMILGETKPQPTFSSLSSEPSTSSSPFFQLNQDADLHNDQQTNTHTYTLEDNRVLYLKNPREPPEKPLKHVLMPEGSSMYNQLAPNQVFLFARYTFTSVRNKQNTFMTAIKTKKCLGINLTRSG